MAPPRPFRPARQIVGSLDTGEKRKRDQRGASNGVRIYGSILDEVNNRATARSIKKAKPTMRGTVPVHNAGPSQLQDINAKEKKEAQQELHSGAYDHFSYDEAHIPRIALSSVALNRLDQYAWDYNPMDEDYASWTSVPINDAANINNLDDEEAELRRGVDVNHLDIMDGLDGPEVQHRQ